MADSALVREIMQKINKLNKPLQEQVLEYVDSLTAAPFDQVAWLKRANAMREKLIAERGADFTVSVVDLINESREERLNDILRGL